MQQSSSSFRTGINLCCLCGCIVAGALYFLFAFDYLQKPDAITTFISFKRQFHQQQSVTSDESATQNTITTASHLRASTKMNTTATKVIITQSNASSSVAPTTATNGSRSRSDDSKPTIVLHIGIPKTGTTFLQCSLSRNAYEFLKKDNYTYLGTCSCQTPEQKYDMCLPHHANTIFPSDDLSNTTMNPELAAILPQLHREKRNTMMVWEYFSFLNDKRMDVLVETFKDWNVEIVVNYRRLYEWLPSMYAQKNTPFKWRKWLYYWPPTSNKTITTTNGADDGQQSSSSMEGIPTLPFDMYTSDERKALLPINADYKHVIDSIEKSSLHPTKTAIKHWKKYFPNATINIVDLHSFSLSSSSSTSSSDQQQQQKHDGFDDVGNPMLIHLFCEAVSHAPYTCRAAKANKIDIITSKSNARNPANYDLLVLKAHEEGLLTYGNYTVPRDDARQETKYRQETMLNMTSTDFPSQCMTDESLERLFNLSLTLEQDLFPTGRLDNEQNHRVGFMEKVHKGSYCFINTEETLKDKDWREFFVSLAKKAQQQE